MALAKDFERVPSSGARGDRDVTKEQLAEEWFGSPPELPWTTDIAAAVWGLSVSRVQVLCDQGRVKHVRRGWKNVYLILQRERPERAAPGALTEEQRAVKVRR